MSEELSQLIDAYLEDAQLMGWISSASAKKYKKQLVRLFLKTNIELISDITTEKIKKFILFKKEAGTKTITIRGYLYPLKKMIEFLKKQKGQRLAIDLAEIPIPRDKRKEEVIFLTEEELDKFIKAITENTKNTSKISTIRFLALVYFLLETGARISEALSIKIEDVDWGRREVSIIGKGSKRRTLVFRGKSEYYLKRYLEIRGGSCEFLFAILNGESVWKQPEIDGLFRKFKHLAGIKKKVSAHILRHTFCTHLLFKGIPLNFVSRMAGHSSPVITLKYYAGVMEEMQLKEKVKEEHFSFIPEIETASLE